MPMKPKQAYAHERFLNSLFNPFLFPLLYIIILIGQEVKPPEFTFIYYASGGIRSLLSAIDKIEEGELPSFS